MKTAIKLILILFSFITCAKPGFGQIPSYTLSAENFHPNGDYYTANEFTFDIVIRHTDNTLFEYAGGEYSLFFNTEVANGGTLSYSFAGPDTSDLPLELRPRNPDIVYGGRISKLVLGINNFPGQGNGFIIPIDSGIKIAKMKLRTTAVTFQMDSSFPLGGWYWINFMAEWNSSVTKIYAYIGSSPVEVAPFVRYIENSGLAVNPVELSGFTSNVDKNIVALYWNTSAEINNYGFEIERESFNDQWIKVAFVKGNGTTNETSNYSFTEKLTTGKYHYRLKQIDYNGNYEYFDLADEVRVGLPQKIELSQNYPNPFNPSTKIYYTIPNNEHITLKVYDITGRSVKTLVNGSQSAGYYEINFDASDLPGGVYFYSLVSEGFRSTKRMVLIK